MLWKSKKLTWHIPKGRSNLLPKKATSGSIAYDLISPVDIVIPAYHSDLGVGSALINTLVAVTLPDNYGLVLRSRSGLASKKAITVEAGEIDTDYTGMIHVLLYNHSGLPYEIKAGDRIAQARLVKVHKLKEEVSYQYPDAKKTKRGNKGFGSTGK